MDRIITRVARIVEIRIEHDHKSIMVESDSHGREIILVPDSLMILENEYFHEKEVEDLSVNYQIYIYMYENSPMMMSEPPQYTPLFLIVAQNEDELFQKIDFFDEDLVSSDNQLKINLESRVISLSHHDLVKDLLVNKQLLVFYHKSTRSIPAIAYPLKVIIL